MITIAFGPRGQGVVMECYTLRSLVVAVEIRAGIRDSNPINHDEPAHRTAIVEMEGLEPPTKPWKVTISHRPLRGKFR
jgi:hypothetical protein